MFENFPVQQFNDLRQLLIDCNILHMKQGKYIRFSSWQKQWDETLDIMFNNIKLHLSSDDELWYCLRYNIIPITDSYICPVCHIKRIKFTGNGWRSTCIDCFPNSRKDIKRKPLTDEQKKIIRQKTEKTLMERYGDPHYNNMAKNRATKLERYGDPHYNNVEKLKQTNLEKYGVVTNLLLPECKEKANTPEIIQRALKTREQTNLKRYGVKYIAQVKESSKKMWDTRHKHLNDYAQNNDCTLFADLLRQYGQGWLRLENIPFIYYKHHTFVPNNFISTIEKYANEGTHTNQYTSKGEKELAEYIKSLGVDIEENNTNTVSNRNGRYYELDILVPSQKVAFDFNGMYWHSTLFKDRNYHKRKSDYCREDGIRLIHIFEDLWISKKDIYKSIIKASLNIYDRKIFARKCTVVKLSVQKYKDFLNQNHLQGEVNSSIRLGLKYDNELVQVVGFGKSRFTNEMELHRMCSLLNTQVIGGFSKLIKHSNIDNFISYVDLSIYNGESYQDIGFEIVKYTEPGYFYIKDYIRYNRLNFQKHKLKEKLDDFNPELSEYENMIKNGYFCIYDCGNLKLSYKRSE